MALVMRHGPRVRGLGPEPDPALAAVEVVALGAGQPLESVLEQALEADVELEVLVPEGACRLNLHELRDVDVDGVVGEGLHCAVQVLQPQVDALLEHLVHLVGVGGGVHVRQELQVLLLDLREPLSLEAVAQLVHTRRRAQQQVGAPVEAGVELTGCALSTWAALRGCHASPLIFHIPWQPLGLVTHVQQEVGEAVDGGVMDHGVKGLGRAVRAQRGRDAAVAVHEGCQNDNVLGVVPHAARKRDHLCPILDAPLRQQLAVHRGLADLVLLDDHHGVAERLYVAEQAFVEVRVGVLDHLVRGGVTGVGGDADAVVEGDKGGGGEAAAAAGLAARVVQELHIDGHHFECRHCWGRMCWDQLRDRRRG
mmetsp:Transcript_71581/g.125982  ORF Transcript_71581/g.125982 Transcript_71581/m.125982 type:complete len:366 (+) Transcript_71581:4803-5900(+)